MANQCSNLHMYTVLLLLIYPAFAYFVPDARDDATPGSWEDAKAQCKNAGSTLATVPGDNNDYNDAANEACDYYCANHVPQIVPGDCRCWIGLKANIANGPFTYDDDTIIDTADSYGFTGGNRPTTDSQSPPWAAGKPSENANANICVYAYFNDYSWYDVNCDGGGDDIYPLCNGDKTTGCQADCTKCANKDECSDSRLICAYADQAVGGTGCVPQTDTP
eukprot:25838_1